MNDVVNKIIELALGQGLWVLLYIYLFFRMLSENKVREERILSENKAREYRYQGIIDRLSGSIEAKVAHIQETLDDMAAK